MKNTVKVFVRTVGVIIDIIGIFRKRKYQQLAECNAPPTFFER